MSIKADTYAFKISVVVRPTARVNYRGLEYSAPADVIGQTVTLHLQAQQVAIYLVDRLLAEHPRFPENGKSSVLSQHAEQLFQFRRGKPYAQRQILLDLDPMVEPYLTELVHRCPLGWESHVDKIYQLYEQIGRADLLASIALATEVRCFGSEYLLSIAENLSPSSVTAPMSPSSQ